MSLIGLFFIGVLSLLMEWVMGAAPHLPRLNSFHKRISLLFHSSSLLLISFAAGTARPSSINKKRVKLDGRGLGAAPLGPKHITLYSVIKEMNHSFLYEGGNGEEDNQPIPFNSFNPHSL